MGWPGDVKVTLGIYAHQQQDAAAAIERVERFVADAGGQRHLRPA